MNELGKLINLEQLRLVVVSVLSPILGYLTPTRNFLVALAIMFAFNIFCGMRADGVSVVRCKKFSMKKFKNSLIELFIYVAIVNLLYTTVEMIGEGSNAVTIVKGVTVVFLYVYFQNGLKNLIIAYPRNVSFRIIYHVVRLEFKRAAPDHVKGVIERVEKELEKGEKK